MPEAFPVARGRADAVTLQQARHMFFEQGRLPATLVSGAILESWRRCQLRGQSADAQPEITPVTVHELNSVLARNEGLRRVCRPEMEALGQVARATQSLLVLASADGLILETSGDLRFSSRAAEVSLRPGTSWSEASSGTNAIGTAIVQGNSVLVRGGEHYHTSHAILSCAATPIHDPHGAIIGVLDLTGPAALAHPHTLGLVEMAVSQIEHRQFDQGFEGADIMVLSREPGLLGTAREGILVFEGQQLVAASRAGLLMAGLGFSALGTLRDEEIFRAPLTRGAHEMSLRGRTNGRVFARFRPRLPRMVRGARVETGHSTRPAPIPEPLVRDAAFSCAVERGLAWAGAGLNLLIRGESGTGKTRLAEALHGALAPSCPLVLLHGHDEDPQRLDAALLEAREAENGATLVIKDVFALSPLQQARLARALEAWPTGAARIIATARPVDAVGQAHLRDDVLYTLAQGQIDLPPLRNRMDLRESLHACLGTQAGIEAGPGIEEAACAMLLAHPWPGNWRELSGVLRAMRVLAGPNAPLATAHLPAGFRPNADTPPAASNLNALTRQAMQSALEAAGGNVSRAARALGVDRTTLYRRLLWKERG